MAGNVQPKSRFPLYKPEPIPKAAPTRIKQVGKRELEYRKWRDEQAIPYLDKRFGHTCFDCGTRDNLDVDHQLKRSVRPDLKMDLNNVAWRCRSCHIKKDQ